MVARLPAQPVGVPVSVHEVAGYCYQAVVGEKEEADWSVTLRERGQKKPLGTLVLKDLVAKLEATLLRVATILTCVGDSLTILG